MLDYDYMYYAAFNVHTRYKHLIVGSSSNASATLRR